MMDGSYEGYELERFQESEEAEEDMVVPEENRIDVVLECAKR